MAADAEVGGAEVFPEDELSPDLCLWDAVDLIGPFANELLASTGRIGVAFSRFCSRFIFCFLRGRGGDVLLRGAVTALAAVAIGPKFGSMKAVREVGGAAEDMVAATGAAVQVGLLLHVMICLGVTCATLGAGDPIICCCCCCCCWCCWCRC